MSVFETLRQLLTWTPQGQDISSNRNPQQGLSLKGEYVTTSIVEDPQSGDVTLNQGLQDCTSAALTLPSVQNTLPPIEFHARVESPTGAVIFFDVHN